MLKEEGSSATERIDVTDNGFARADVTDERMKEVRKKEEGRRKKGRSPSGRRKNVQLLSYWKPGFLKKPGFSVLYFFGGSFLKEKVKI
jgi:hypothetical protein